MYSNCDYNPGSDQMFIVDYVVIRFNKRFSRTLLTFAPNREIAQRKVYSQEKSDKVILIKTWGCFPWEMHDDSCPN